MFTLTPVERERERERERELIIKIMTNLLIHGYIVVEWSFIVYIFIQRHFQNVSVQTVSYEARVQCYAHMFASLFIHYIKLMAA